MCIVVVAVMHRFDMKSYFPEAGNLNGSNAEMCSDVAGPSIRGVWKTRITNSRKYRTANSDK